MKLIIQIPCFNEAETLPVTLAGLPRRVEGFDQVEWLVVDDGSSDRTSETARSLGVEHVLRLNKNQGLARAFMAGLEACLDRGADVIVNLDADNQYAAADIPRLVRPILEKSADMVIGTRPIQDTPHFSWLKKRLQRLGSWVVRVVSRTNVEDAPSGFRAISRETAQRLNVFSDYTYTLETIVQAGQKNLMIATCPVGVNAPLRPSRLVKSTWAYIVRSMNTMFRIFVVYRPFKFFMTIGLILFSSGLLLGLRFLYFLAQGGGKGHVQSLILASVLLGIGFQTMLTAFLADLFAVNRKLLEDIQFRLRKRPAKGSE